MTAPWYKRWFSESWYLEVYAHRDERDAREVVELFRRVTALPDGARVLDLACGAGRHAVELARAGFSVVGADLSAPLLAQAQRTATRLGDGPGFVRADMRTLPFRGGFHGVVQLFTAFGYFPDDAQDAEVLHQVRAALSPGGWYLLDFLNASRVRRNLVPVSERAITGGTIVQERRILDDRVEKRITIRRGTETRVFTESVRLYTAEELTDMLRTAGFVIQECMGSYDGASLQDSSPRCILFART